MEIEINAAVVHVLDTAADAPVLSALTLDLNEETLAYLTAHVGKCFASEEAKACTLSEESPVLPLLWNLDDNFANKTGSIADKWFSIMQQQPAIPAGDAVFVLASIDGADWLGALKLNYKTGYVHYYAVQDGTPRNEIVRQRAVLPGTAGKADEAFFVGLAAREVRVIEKQYEIDGRKAPYLAAQLLQCKPGLSAKEKLAAIRDVAVEVNQQFYGNTGVDEPELAAAVCEEYHAARVAAAEKPAAGTPTVQVAELCEKLYADMPHAREAFTRALEERSIALEEPLPLSAPAVRRMEKQTLRSGTGVEIKVPVSVYRDASAIEFIRGEDGTTSVIIKNVLL